MTVVAENTAYSSVKNDYSESDSPSTISTSGQLGEERHSDISLKNQEIPTTIADSPLEKYGFNILTTEIQLHQRLQSELENIGNTDAWRQYKTSVNSLFGTLRKNARRLTAEDATKLAFNLRLILDEFINETPSLTEWKKAQQVKNPTKSEFVVPTRFISFEKDEKESAIFDISPNELAVRRAATDYLTR
jgi:hypothetical protein